MYDFNLSENQRYLIYNGVKYDKYIIDDKGKIYSLHRNRNLKTRKDGYAFVMITDYPGHDRRICVHRALFNSFHPDVDITNLEIDHIDGDHYNNDLSNLEPVTSSENKSRAAKNDMVRKGKNKWTEDNVRKICEELASSNVPSLADIAVRNNTSVQRVMQIKNRKRWSTISKDYVWADVTQKMDVLSDDVVRDICQALQDGESQASITRRLGIDHRAISNIYNRRTHKDISKDYQFDLTDEKRMNLQKGEIVKEFINKEGKTTNLIVSNMGRFFRKGTLKELKLICDKNRDAEPRVDAIVGDERKHTHYTCKVVVASLFCANPNNEKHVIYKNGVVGDLRASNLKFESLNTLKKINGTFDKMVALKSGENNHGSKLKKVDVYRILQLHFEYGVTRTNLANVFGVHPPCIDKILCGQRWHPVYEDYMQNRKNV